jgi:inosine/xanthosine triphosphatase
MRVVVGSKAPPKVEAVREVLVEYLLFKDCTVDFVDVPSDVSSHPMTPEELLAGANNRARAAFKDCDFSVGIEDGSVEWPGTRTGLFTLSLCAIYDGKEFFHGISCGFESPLAVTGLVKNGVELSDAWAQTGLHRGSKIGYGQGSIGLLTKGRVPRKEQIKQGIRMALIELENPGLYSKKE